jgi:ABC-type dipeptide/oligopeptide/nickel transport system permease component
VPSYLLRRLVGAGLVLAAVSLAVFVALTYVPGDAADSLLGESASAGQLAALRQEMGLDEALPVRYARFVAGVVLHGDLGRSVVSGRAVSDLLAERIFPTAVLALTAICLAVVLGTTAGSLAATHSGSRVDLAVMGVSSLGMAVPTYWLSLLLVMIFSLKLRWLPVAGAGSLAHLILPAITLALPTAAVVARLIRSSLLDVLHADFLRTARAKGLPARLIFLDHTLRNSLIPVVTLLGLHLGHLLGGAFVIETIFAWPGLGRLAVQAIFDRDLPVVLGAALLMAAINVTINLGVDLLHAILDPRVGRSAL